MVSNKFLTRNENGLQASTIFWFLTTRATHNNVWVRTHVLVCAALFSSPSWSARARAREDAVCAAKGSGNERHIPQEAEALVDASLHEHDQRPGRAVSTGRSTLYLLLLPRPFARPIIPITLSQRQLGDIVPSTKQTERHLPNQCSLHDTAWVLFQDQLSVSSRLTFL